MGDKNKTFSHNLSDQADICDLGLAPKKITTPEYEGLSNYAYHLDAKEFVRFLKDWSINKLGVQHLSGTIEVVNKDASGFITSVVTKEQFEINADLFIDCTGFSCLLLGKHLEVPFVDKKEILFVDSAIAIQVPYKNTDVPIACSTISTAQEAGWTWDIGLQSRRGVGYVYSANHTTDDCAESLLREYIGKPADNLNSNKFKMKVGHREKFWYKNCVAVGFSAGFLEPLESTALIFVEAAATMICDQFPHHKDAMPIIERKFNKAFRYRFERAIDFVKLHYYISKRDDSAFWLDNRVASTAPDSLLENLEFWKSKAPAVYDFPNIYETFTLDSYQWILYGLNYPTNLTLSQSKYRDEKRVAVEFRRVQQAAKNMVQNLPEHRELINKILKYGLAKV